jgi:hypothetical protein
LRQAWAMANGMAMYMTTEMISVSHGTTIAETPSSSATSGAKANSMIRSLSATCVSVKFGSPFDRLLQTKTMAVQGAAASRISPAM